MAKMMREHPDEITKKEHQDKDHKCAVKAVSRGQLTFTLVEQDRSTPKTIAYWILENIETCPAAKLYDALESAIVARSYVDRKAAD